MLIYIFVDYFPNPYKPYFDTQFVELLSQGHDIRIYAGAAYMSTVNKEIEQYRLDKQVRFYPFTLRDVPKYFSRLGYKWLINPLAAVRKFNAIYDAKISFKNNIMSYFRASLLDEEIPDICLVHNLGVASMFTFLKKIYPHAKVAMYFHGGEVGKTPTIKLDQYSFNSVDRVFTNTIFSRDQAISRGCDKFKLKIVPVGFNLDEYNFPTPRQYRHLDKLNLISIGRLSEEKGHIYVIQAIEELLADKITNFTYTIVGNGYIKDELEEYTRNAKLEKHVIFAGEKSKADVMKELELSDVLILPSLATKRWSETQACVVQEALLMGNLAIVNQTGGVPESISENMHKLMVQPEDSHGIAEKIKYIMSLTKDEIQSMAIDGREFVVRKYNIKTVTSELLGTFNDDNFIA